MAKVRQIAATKETEPPLAARQSLNLDYKEGSFVRLRRIEGQVRGIQRMLDDDRPIPDMVGQIASIQEALRGLAKLLMTIHIESAATDAFRNGTPEEVHATLSESVELIYRHLR